MRNRRAKILHIKGLLTLNKGISSENYFKIQSGHLSQERYLDKQGLNPRRSIVVVLGSMKDLIMYFSSTSRITLSKQL